MDRIKRISKTILKKYRKNSKRYNVALGALLLLSIGLGIYLLIRVKPNDDIFFLNTNDRAVLGNKNPSFNVLFGERDDSTSQWVRFEAKASSKNPFGIENEKFFTKLFRTVKPKKEYGIEMSLEGVGLSETELLDLGGQEEVVKSVADIVGTDDIETSTELIESGRIIGQYTEDPVSKQTVLNKSVANGVDIEYQILEGVGVKEEIVIRNMEEYSGDCSEDLENCAVPLNRFVFDLKLDEGLELKKGWFTIEGESSESYYFVDSEGNYVAHFLPSWAIDGAGNKTYDVDLIVEEDNDNYGVEVIVDAEWLFSAERVYPIRIDPSIVHDTKTLFDTGFFERTESFDGARVEIEQPKGGVIDADTEGYWSLDDNTYTDEAGSADGMTTYNGIEYGLRDSNLTIIANQWNGVANDGELDITCVGGDTACYIITKDGDTLSTPSINYGIAMIESAAVSAFVMYSPSLSAQSITPYTNGSNNFIGVRYTGSAWQYDNNSTWVTFTPTSDNILIASLTTGNPTITNLEQNHRHPYSLSGQVDGALVFNGTDDFINLGLSSINTPLNGASQVTVSAWIKPNSYPGGTSRKRIVSVYTENGYTGLAFSLFGEDKVELGARSQSTDAFQVLAYSSPKLSDWTHVVGIYDFANDKMFLYLNGALVAQEDVTFGSSTYVAGTPTTFYDSIGASIADAAKLDFFDGSIDEISVSSVARTQDEITRDYIRGMGNIYGIYTSAELDLDGDATIDSISWVENGVHTGDGETPYSTTGLVAQWNFNETSGTTAVSGGTCGTSCNGTLTSFDSTASQDADPDSGWTYDNRRWGAGAAMFDGVDSYITVPHNSAMNFGTGDFSVSTWVKFDNSTDHKWFLEKDATPATAGFNLMVFQSDDAAYPNKIRWNIRGTSGGSVYSDEPITDKQWHHIVGVRESGALKLYIDGVLQQDIATGITESVDTTEALTIGNYSTALTTYALNGVMDSTSMYSRALSATEVLSNYQAGNIEFQYRTSSDGSTWGDWVTGLNTNEGEYVYSTTSSNLEAYWPMDETADNTCSGGEDACDVVGSYDATDSGGSTITNGIYGKARSFDGSDDVLTTSYPNSPGSGDLTLEAWIKVPSGQTGERVILSQENTSWDSVYLSVDPQWGYLNFYRDWSSSAGEWVTDDGVITTDTWHHVVVTYAALFTTNDPIFYVDGVVQTLQTDTNPTGSVDSSTQNWTIGDNASSTAAFIGQIDEVRFYDTILSATTIEEQYLNGLAGKSSVVLEDFENPYLYDTSESGLVSYWPMDEVSGTSVEDVAGTYDGTASGTRVVNGKHGEARGFDGASYVGTAVDTEVDSLDAVAGNAWSTEAWFKTSGVSSNSIITGRGGGTGTSATYATFLTSTGELQTVIKGTYTTLATGVADGEWHYVVVTWDGTTGYGYYDGGAPITLNIGAVALQDNIFTIGATANGSNGYFTGDIDEVRIYNVALPTNVIQNRYLEGVIGSSAVKSSADSIVKSDSGDYSRNLSVGGGLVDAHTMGYWKLDETGGTGAYIKDYSGNGNDGTPTDATYVDGNIGGARSFNGTSSYIDVGSDTSINLTDDLTIEAWIYTPAYGANVITTWASAGAASYPFHFLLLSTGNLRMNSNSFANVDSTGVVPLNEWSHVAVIIDGTNIKFYINGLLDSIHYSASAPGRSAGTSFLSISRSEAQYFNGYIDEVRISNIARTGEEIKYAYNLGKDAYFNKTLTTSGDLTTKTKVPFWIASDTLGSNIEAIVGNSAYANYQPDTNLVGHWRMDDPSVDSRIPTKVANLQGYWDLTERSGTGAYLLDKSVNSNHGTPTGTTYGDGILGGGRNFNGSSCIATAADTEADRFFSDATSAWSAEAWFKTTGVSANAAIIGKGGGLGTAATFGAFVDTSGGLQTVIRGAYTSLSSAVADGEWHHVVVTWNGTTGYGYVDGGSATTLTIGTAAVQAPTFDIGGTNNCAASLFTGDIDEVGIYDRALSASEVTERYNSILYKDIKDSSGYGNDGKSNDLGYEEGKIGGSRKFDAVDDKIIVEDVASSLDVSGTDQLTIDAWIYPTGDPTDSRGAIATAVGSYYFQHYIDDRLAVYTYHDGGASSDYMYSTGTVTRNQWNHVVFTENASGVRKIYINGKLDTVGTYEASIRTYSPFLVKIGHESTIRFFSGNIDEVRISNIVRTPEEIREAYEIGKRKFDIKVDFKADLQAGNLIASSGDTSFTISETAYGTTAEIEHLNKGDRVIVRENYGGTVYEAQGVVDSVNTGTGAVTVSSWDTGSTFPASGYTVNASVFKWQEEFLDIRGIMDEQKDDFSLLTLRLKNSVPMNVWVDDLRSQKDLVASDLSSGIAEETAYIQYRPIFTTWDDNVTPYLSSVQVDYTSSGPTMEQLMRHGKWFNSGVKQDFWWAR